MFRDGSMCGQKKGKTSRAVVQIEPQRYELEHLGIAKPVESDPGGGRTASDGITREFVGDPLGLSPKSLIRRRRPTQFGELTPRRRSRWTVGSHKRVCVDLDDLDLPVDLVAIKVDETRSCTRNAVGRRQPLAKACLIPQLVAVCPRDKV